MTDHHSVYVVELDQDVWSDRRFKEANKGCSPDASCYYVGLTGLTPEERFARHKAGIQASRIVKRFGLRLVPEWYEDMNPMSWPEAAKTETALAEELRERGYGVWQH